MWKIGYDNRGVNGNFHESCFLTNSWHLGDVKTQLEGDSIKEER